MMCVDCKTRAAYCRGRCRSCYSIAAARGKIVIKHYKGEMVCRVPGCVNAGFLRRGLCHMHYTRLRKHGTTDERRPMP